MLTVNAARAVLPGSRRSLHLAPANAFKVLADAGIKTPSFHTVSSSGVEGAFDSLASSEARVYADVTSAFGRPGLRTGSFNGGSLPGISWPVSSAKEAKAIADKVVGKPLDIPGAPTGLEIVPESVTIVAASKGKSARILFYCDRAHGQPGLLGTTANLDAEAGLPYLRHHNPNDVALELINYKAGLSAGDATAFAKRIGFSDTAASAAGQLLAQAYRDVFVKHEALRVEFILEANEAGEVVANDPQLHFDPFALQRHPDIAALRNKSHEHAAELEAEKAGLFYIKFGAKDNADNVKGDVACFGYGAGLAMATSDAVVDKGGRPANFLDGGGGANATNAELSILTLASDPDVKSIFVNIFGGLTRCDWVGEGIVNAFKKSDRLRNGEIPTTVRLLGNKSDIGRQSIKDAGLNVHFVSDFQKAAENAVKQAREASSKA